MVNVKLIRVGEKQQAVTAFFQLLNQLGDGLVQGENLLPGLDEIRARTPIADRFEGQLEKVLGFHGGSLHFRLRILDHFQQLGHGNLAIRLARSRKLREVEEQNHVPNVKKVVGLGHGWDLSVSAVGIQVPSPSFTKLETWDSRP